MSLKSEMDWQYLEVRVPFRDPHGSSKGPFRGSFKGLEGLGFSDDRCLKLNTLRVQASKL